MGGLPTTQPVRAFAADLSKTPVMFAALLDSLWNSQDAGKTWHRLANTSGITALAVHPRTPDVVFAGTADGRILRSADGGGSWEPAR